MPLSRARLSVAIAVLGLHLTTPSLAAQNRDLELPTPAAHFASFDVEQDTRGPKAVNLQDT